MHREDGIDNERLQVWLNKYLIVDTNVLNINYSDWLNSLNEGCPEFQSTSEELAFGLGRVIPNENPDETVIIPHMHARVDNLMVIEPHSSIENRIDGWGDTLLWAYNVGGPSPIEVEMYRDVELLFDNPVEDGFAWWHFDRATSNIGSFDIRRVAVSKGRFTVWIYPEYF